MLGTLVTTELEPTPPLERTAARAGSASTRARRARSTSLARSTRRAASRSRRRRRADPGGVPRGDRGLRLRLRHLPGRLPLEPRRRETARADGRRAAEPRRSRRWLEEDGTSSSSGTTGSTCRERPALAAAKRDRGAREHRRPEHARARARAAGDDELLAEHAGGRSRGSRRARAGRPRDLRRTEPGSRCVRLGASPSPSIQVVPPHRLPQGYELAWAWFVDRDLRGRRDRSCSSSAGGIPRPAAPGSPSSRSSSTPRSSRLSPRLQLRVRQPDPFGALFRRHRGRASLPRRRRHSR